MKSIFEFIKIAVVLILGNIVTTIVMLPIVFCILYVFIWLIVQSFVDPSVYVFGMDLFLLVAWFQIMKIPKLHASWKELKEQIRRNI